MQIDKVTLLKMYITEKVFGKNYRLDSKCLPGDKWHQTLPLISSHGMSGRFGEKRIENEEKFSVLMIFGAYKIYWGLNTHDCPQYVLLVSLLSRSQN